MRRHKYRPRTRPRKQTETLLNIDISAAKLVGTLNAD